MGNVTELQISNVNGVLGDVVHRVNRAGGDIVDHVSGLAVPNSRICPPSEESARNKYGPKVPDRQWERGTARMAPHLSFSYLHAKCAPPGCVSSVALNTTSIQAEVVQVGAPVTPEIAKLRYSDIHEEHEFMSELDLGTEEKTHKEEEGPEGEKEGPDEEDGESASM